MSAYHVEQLLAAIQAAAVQRGIIAAGQSVTGPQALMLCADLGRAPVTLARQAVASVVSRSGNHLRVGWLRPELCEVGTLLYRATEQAPGADLAEHLAQEAAKGRDALAALGHAYGGMLSPELGQRVDLGQTATEVLEERHTVEDLGRQALAILAAARNDSGVMGFGIARGSKADVLVQQARELGILP